MIWEKDPRVGKELLQFPFMLGSKVLLINVFLWDQWEIRLASHMSTVCTITSTFLARNTIINNEKKRCEKRGTHYIIFGNQLSHSLYFTSYKPVKHKSSLLFPVRNGLSNTQESTWKTRRFLGKITWIPCGNKVDRRHRRVFNKPFLTGLL